MNGASGHTAKSSRPRAAIKNEVKLSAIEQKSRAAIAILLSNITRRLTSVFDTGCCDPFVAGVPCRTDSRSAAAVSECDCCCAKRPRALRPNDGRPTPSVDRRGANAEFPIFNCPRRLVRQRTSGLFPPVNKILPRFFKLSHMNF